MTLYDKIKCLCDSLKISIRECEKRANLGNGTIAGWDVSIPRADKLNAVAVVVGSTVEILLDGIEQKKGEGT